MSSGSDKVGVNWDAFNKIKKDFEDQFGKKRKQKQPTRDKSKPKSKSPYDQITIRQLDYVKAIEKKVGVPFTGTTKRDAFLYITKHKAKFYDK